MLVVSKLVALRRRMTSSMRGCSQPDVALGVECAAVLLVMGYRWDGVDGEGDDADCDCDAGGGGEGAWRRGVRFSTGSELFVFELLVRVSVSPCCEVASAVDDMVP
jgi:hypothetical protein